MSKRILIVDDEKPTLEMLSMLLEGYGYEVLTAADGREAVEVYERERPPIVLTDIKMPIMDGMAVLQRIKEINPLAEVIVVTGHGDMDLAIKALDLEATDFVNKPVQRRTLDQALQRAENRIQMARNLVETLQVEARGEDIVITASGSITASAESLLQGAFEHALESGKRRIHLCFGPNASINGAGIALLTDLLVLSRERHVPVSLVGVHDNFQEIFEIVGITKLVTVHKTLDEALASAL